MKKNIDCIFCKIVKQQLPAYKIYEDKLVLAFLDIAPVNIGHALVIPKKHFENLNFLPEKTAGHILKVAQKISRALIKIGADGTNISMNNGKHAGQIVFHSHTHIIPRFKKDKLDPWPKKDVTKKRLEVTAQKIIQAL